MKGMMVVRLKKREEEGWLKSEKKYSHSHLFVLVF